MHFLPTVGRWSLARSIPAAALVALALTPASAAAATRDTGPPCLNADLAPTAANLKQVRTAILCLTNRDRAERGRAPLVENARLRTAAVGHSDDMVHGQYFAHTTPDGAGFVDRIVVARYVHRSDGWALGENLAWGTGNRGTPAGVHAAWMRSSGHRSNILKASYREIGIGVRPGVPQDPGMGATYTNDFGVKL